MKKIRNKSKLKKQQAKKARKRRTSAEQKARSKSYSLKLQEKKRGENRKMLEFIQTIQQLNQKREAGDLSAGMESSDEE